MENLWYLHLYWMGCGGEGESAVKFNGGPFLMHRDSRSWGTSYWYQNTRELYWCLPAANHLPLCAGLQRLYLTTVPAHRQLAKELFGKRGLQIEETMNIAGPGDKRGNPYTMLYLSTGLECALQLYHQAVFARDDRLLREEVLPLMKEAVDFYMDYATLGADGRYHIVPEDARETYWRVQDGMTSICRSARSDSRAVAGKRTTGPVCGDAGEMARRGSIAWPRCPSGPTDRRTPRA